MNTFWPAYLEALLFLEVMNWYDGIIIDKIRVGYSKFWMLPGCEDLPYVQTWPQVLKKRGFLTLIWIVGAAIVAGIVLIALLTLVMIKINHATTFLQGFGWTYSIWLAITWYDALILDCLWFCHSKRVRIPGTEDMKEYRDYLFHVKASCIGSLIGLPACAVVGLIVMLLA